MRLKLLSLYLQRVQINLERIVEFFRAGPTSGQPEPLCDDCLMRADRADYHVSRATELRVPDPAHAGTTLNLCRTHAVIRGVQ